MAEKLDLEPDCASCLGLCCAATGFEKSDQYAFAKPAGDPCRLLQRDFRCGIHNDLAEKGMKGCDLYTCFGAGQNVSQRLFPGVDWRRSPDTAQEVFDTFYKLKELHELIWVLRLTLSACADGPERDKVSERIAEVESKAHLDAAATQALDVNALRRGSQSAIDGVHWNVTIGRKGEQG